MKKLTPANSQSSRLIDLLLRCKRSCQGFTLIELMVSITIVAIMAVAGIIVYTQVQQNARDARRREDLAAIATAIEGAKDPVSGNYVDVADAALVGGEFPLDPLGSGYCYANNSTKIHPTDPAITNRSSCPNPYSNLNNPDANLRVGGSGVLSWKVCAMLEKGSAVICRSSSQ